ncbi:flagellar hook capping FlgD N-terminal domain-containing protein [Massilia litorea]|jgi:flagellar basal-body rod modification protein FlgD|uniref:Basal-body rod modification protein FlgD n=1 Tax=Massilia litorea TaxID=2769491 RepID=A0A7L9U404_9BURK|nr:flagellar hook capping FlgD N-terminal domain-containing protein [Massilia litorea]QOL49801.1 flagellar basal body rod modification protein [Massilia litorea]
MLTNNSLAASNNTAGTDSVAPSAEVSANKDMFTKLLVAQIRNQDPLAPSDPSQFVNQLSQLSQTEALQNLSKTTSASASVLQSLQVLAMGGQVGSQVTVATDRLRLDGAPVSGSIQLPSASGATNLVLTGADGQAHNLALPYHAAGSQAFTIDPSALGLAPGSYSIAARTADGAAVPVEIAGTVSSVRLSGTGSVVLQVAGVGDIDPSAITGFNGKAPAFAAN